MSLSAGFLIDVCSFQCAAFDVCVILIDIMEQSGIVLSFSILREKIHKNGKPKGQGFWQSTLWCSTLSSPLIVILRLLVFTPEPRSMLQLPLQSDQSVQRVGTPERTKYLLRIWRFDLPSPSSAMCFLVIQVTVTNFKDKLTIMTCAVSNIFTCCFPWPYQCNVLAQEE